MALLSELYVALRTRNTSDAETDDSPVLVVQRNSNTLWSKKLFGDYLEARGAGAVFRFDVADAQIDSADLDLQLWASGDDAWSPEHVIAWGVAGTRGEERVIPLSAFLDLANPLTPEGAGVWISGDTSEGERILFLPRVGRGRDGTQARRLIVVTATDPYGNMFPSAAGPGGDLSDCGTKGPLTLQAGVSGRMLLDYTLPSTPQSDQDEGGGAFYIVDLAAPFSRNDVSGGQFTLTIGSDDWWKPDYIAVFGVAPEALIPFVAAPAFDLKQMSSDPSEGWHSLILPTARVFAQPRFPTDDIVSDVGGVVEA
ncbi:MAG TPA: hypothetical protein VHE36_03820 [Sphingomicrobium sp.]|nr:hypothetical protein [Sphingomicrobium sp.]